MSALMPETLRKTTKPKNEFNLANQHKAIASICMINKVIALRGSTPKRESQQQCSCTNNTANHAMLCHTMTYNATPYNLCNAIRCHTMQHHDHHAMQHHTTPFHAMQ